MEIQKTVAKQNSLRVKAKRDVQNLLIALSLVYSSRILINLVKI